MVTSGFKQQEKNMFKIIFRLFVTLILLSASLVLTGITKADITKRIEFAKGKSSATVKGSVLRDEIDTYIIKADKGQKMTVKVSAVENNASFSIENPSGEYVEGAGEMDDQTVWSGTLAESGDYKITVAPTRGNATYRLTLSIFAQSDECAIKAWVEDKELEKDIFIHDKPDTLAKIIGEIPVASEDGEEIIVEIIGYSTGWLKIRKAVTIEDKIIFEGKGWIRAGRVSANVQRPDGNSKKGAILYAQAKKSSKTVGTIPSETLIDIIGFDCFGLKVKYKGKIGWIQKDHICGNPVTTCS
jgi:hypothetical protein